MDSRWTADGQTTDKQMDSGRTDGRTVDGCGWRDGQMVGQQTDRRSEEHLALELRI